MIGVEKGEQSGPSYFLMTFGIRFYEQMVTCPSVQHTANPDFCFQIPKVVTKDGVYILDLAAKIDATADYICKVKWGDVEFPPPFGREAYPEASNNLLWPESLSCALRD